MNSRERVRRILNHQEADRPAIDLGSTRMTGMSAWTYRALKRALGVPGDQVRVYDLYQMLAEVEEPVLDALGADFVMLPIDELPFNLPYGAWEPRRFWDGQVLGVPAGFRPRVTPEGALEAPWLRNDDSIMMRMPPGGRYFDQVPGERQDTFDIPHKDPSEWAFDPPPTDEWLRREQDKARALYESSERAIVASPPMSAPQGYAGTYHWAMKMMMEPQHCLDYMMARAEVASQSIALYAQAVGAYVAVINISGYDYGAQNREMFRPELFKRFYVPAWQMYIQALKRHAPDTTVWIHCCGSVPNLIPYFIEAGVEALNPVQFTADGMDLTWLKQTFGDKLVFWGGAISTQTTFPFGTADDVALEARAILDIMAPGGGFVVNPIHNVQADVPVENIVALYRTALAYRYA
jgi:uroporphyrinogen decarboxylase